MLMITSYRNLLVSLML